MQQNLLLYPTLNEELLGKIRFQHQKYSFYYTNEDDDELELEAEQMDSSSSLYCLKDTDGKWTQDDYNICFRKKISIRTFQCLFGKNGIACANSRIGVAVQWTSSQSRQRGVVKCGEFSIDDSCYEAEIEYQFLKAQLRGEVTLSIVLYIAKSGNALNEEMHLANTEGYILGELDSIVLKLDGNGSSFPVYEVTEPGQPLWYISCDWSDPTIDMLSEVVSINLNKAHKNYKYIDRSQKTFDVQLLTEIMASAITLMVEKLRLESGYWEQITQGDDLEPGSVGQAIYYFQTTHGWDLSSPDNVSLSVRKFFDQRM